MKRWGWKRWVWVAFVGVLLYIHLLVGTLVAIATAFYWLLKGRQQIADDQQRYRANFAQLLRQNTHGGTPEEVEQAVQQGMAEFDRYFTGRPITQSRVRDFLAIKAAHQTETPSETRLWCVRGKHYIGNEPYTFIGEGADDANQPICLRCVQRMKHETDRLIGETGEFLRKTKEEMAGAQRRWNALPVETKRAKLEANLSKWAIKGNDGIWHRKDDGTVVPLNEDGTVVMPN